MKLILSELPKTWIIDLDGTIFIHNGHLSGPDKIVDNFLSLYRQIREEDHIIIVTSRDKKYADITKAALKSYHIRYNRIIFNLPKGERLLVNDQKPQGLNTAIAVNVKRDLFSKISLEYSDKK